MKRKATAFAAVLAAGGLSAGAPSLAQDSDFTGQNCMAQEALKAYLKSAFAEGRIASAWSETGNRVELFTGASGTWTLIEYLPDGGGCVRAHGTGMRIDRFSLPLNFDFGT